MIETYEDIKELIDDALNSFRRNNLSVVKKGGAGFSRRNGSETLQLSLGGTDIWRRIILPSSCRLSTLHRIIQILFGWDKESRDILSLDKIPPQKNADGEKPVPEPSNLRLLNFRSREDAPAPYRYSIIRSSGGNQRGFSGKNLHPGDILEDLRDRRVRELLYEYENRWTVKILFFDTNGDSILVFPVGAGGNTAPVRCVAGEGALPPAFQDGPVGFKKFLASRKRIQTDEYDPSASNLTPAASNLTPSASNLTPAASDLAPPAFDLVELNRRLAEVSLD
jgi:hypothetical protein